MPARSRASAESHLHHTGAIDERLARWIRETMGDDPPAATDEHPGVTIAARFSHDECTLSIDLAGAPLHRRGYRLDPARAAARTSRRPSCSSGWDRQGPLVDPMCGSGTIAIEAALIATKTAPGLARLRDRAHEARDGRARERGARERAPRSFRSTALVVASDRDEAAARRTRANAERAAMKIEVAHAALSETPALRLAGQHPTVVTDPPWGERLNDGGAGLERLHAALGDRPRARARRAPRDDRARPAPRAKVGLPLRSAFLTDAGGMEGARARHPDATLDAPRQLGGPRRAIPLTAAERSADVHEGSPDVDSPVSEPQLAERVPARPGSSKVRATSKRSPMRRSCACTI